MITARSAALLLMMCASLRMHAQEEIPPWRGDFERYRNNYVVGGFTFNEQIKFQISIRYRVFTNVPLYFAYSQRSFWDLYDWENSTPFRESNYMPELFYRIIGTGGSFLEYVQLGIEHESNGLGGSDSRSWNKFMIASRFELIEQSVILEPRFWFPFAIARENLDIRTFIGFGQVTGIFFVFPDPANNRLEITLRPGFQKKFKSVSIELNAMIRPITSLGFDLFGANPFMLLQLWHGYGENLIEYNIRSTRFRVGFTF